MDVRRKLFQWLASGDDAMTVQLEMKREDLFERLNRFSEYELATQITNRLLDKMADEIFERHREELIRAVNMEQINPFIGTRLAELLVRRLFDGQRRYP